MGRVLERATKADTDEKVLSRIFTELKKDFEQDLTFEYFKLAQLFDPRVCHRTYPLSLAEIIRLLALAVSTYIPKPESIQTQDGVDTTEDVFRGPRSQSGIRPSPRLIIRLTTLLLPMMTTRTIANLDEVRDRKLEEAAAWVAYFNED